MSNRDHIKGRASERGVDTGSGLPADRYFAKDAVQLGKRLDLSEGQQTKSAL